MAPLSRRSPWRPLLLSQLKGRLIPRLRPLRLLLAWIFAAASVWVAAGLIPGVALGEPGSAFLVAAGVAVINAFLPPLIAALRLPWMLAVGFLAVLFADALALQIAADALRISRAHGVGFPPEIARLIGTDRRPANLPFKQATGRERKIAYLFGAQPVARAAREQHIMGVSGLKVGSQG